MEIAGGIGQLAHLRGGRLDDAFMSVTDVDAPKPGESIEQVTSGGVAHEHALGAFQHGDALGFMRAVSADGVDKMVPVEGDE